ncbi:MAG: integrase/recombinase [Candidatus Magnetoglobus multicellularis str. Araruama]|uniref:Integrase/recombinase n=1 Tax=Candidatus Magnetoglobus multicellularis str. Araruama TaxID=890399 RepID=A0A1V1P2K4_9BACT|nr:MAG: integrase/recombinase [Candidatus Magnetoglobus multicellularis str. Araruama]
MFLFWKKCFDGDGEDINYDKITLDHINKYILSHSKSASLGHTKLLITALRSFFTYLYSRGIIANNIALSIPKIAFWRLSSLPKSLKPDQVEKMLKSCDLKTHIGQRDHAILLLLARLGLRACEIVSMRLEDIDWESGLILIRGKGSREDYLPIPHDVGEAIAQYLKNVRPKCAVRNVFVRIIAPYQGFSSSVAIRDIVDNALTRANIQSIRRGAHLLRHSLAVRMLQNGASLREIGEILRHNSQTTTEIYAKVDLKALHSLAQKWPVVGGAI